MNNYCFIKTDNNEKKYLKVLFLALIPCILFGFYYNGYLLYKHNLISLFDMFKPIYFPLISLIISNIFVSIKNHALKIEYNRFSLYSVLFSLILPSKTPIYFLVGFIVLLNLLLNLLNKKIKFNILALFMILSLLVLNYILKINYNVFDLNINYDLKNYFMGTTLSGVGASSIFAIIISYIIMSCNDLYKKEIPFYSLLSMIIISIIFLIFNKDFDKSILPVVTYNSFFIMTFIASDIYSSPYKYESKVFYGVLLGTLSYLGIIVFKSSLITLLIITLLSFTSRYLNRIFIKK